MAAITRALLISVLLILISFVAFSYWTGTAYAHFPRVDQPMAVDTTGIIDDATLSSKIKATRPASRRSSDELRVEAK